ncbi:lipid-binding SYLF domain-containing protein [Bizionia sp. KMM 8389]
MKKLKTIMAMCLLFISVGAIAQNDKDKKIMADAKKAKTALIERDAGFEKFFNNSAGYVIFPNVGKGGLIIGGASGNGVVYDKGNPIGMADLKEISVGLKAGGQAITEVIFFETETALEKFKEGDFEFSAEASAVAVDQGASKNANYSDGVAVFTMPKKGLMADASVGGQKFSYSPFKM